MLDGWNIHAGLGTVYKSFGSYLSGLLLKICEIYKKCSHFVNFWAIKIQVRILPEIDWYDNQGASPASNIDKGPYK